MPKVSEVKKFAKVKVSDGRGRDNKFNSFFDVSMSYRTMESLSKTEVVKINIII